MTPLLAQAQNILLYQRLIKVMAKLTYGVEVEMQKHMENLELRLQKAGDTVQVLEPELERLRVMLANINDHVTHDLVYSVKKSDDSIKEGLKGADNLHQVLSMLVQTALDGASQVAAVQRKSVELGGLRQDDVNNWAVMIATAVASTESLNSQIVSSFDHHHEILTSST